jgi:hypothetical protein
MAGTACAWRRDMSDDNGWHYYGEEKPRKPIRWRLPYGCWTCANGREVLYNREYSPICERWPGQPPRMANPKEWVADIVRHEWFYNDGTPETQKMKVAKEKLSEWGMLKTVMGIIRYHTATTKSASILDI